MGYTSSVHRFRSEDDPRPDQSSVATSSWFETLCGASCLAIVVIGMIGDDPASMAAIATTAAGFGVFAHAGTRAARSRRSSARDVRAGVGVDLVVGLAGIAIGVLVLARAVPFGWLAIAATAIGVGLLFAGRAKASVDTERPGWRCDAWSVVAMMLAALATVVLAVLAFAAVRPIATLSLAAACAGIGLILAGSGTLSTIQDLDRQ